MTMPAATRPATATLVDRRVAVYLLLLTAASIAWIGYRFSGGNHSVQLPILKHYIDPSLYPRDLLLTTIDGYTTYFFPLMALVARAAGQVELPYFVLYALCHAATLAAVYVLALLVSGHRAGALLACGLYLLNPLSLAGESSLATRLQHGHVATALLLWAIYLHLRGRMLLAFALCGLTFNLHGLYAMYVLAMLAVDATLHRRAGRPARLLSGLGLFALFALPGLVWLFRASQPIASEALPLWLQIMRDRSGLHTFPLSQPPSAYGSYLLFLAVGALGWASTDAPTLRRTTLHFALAIAGLCLAGLVFSEWVPVPLVIKAQLLRSTRWLTYVVLLYLAPFMVLSWRWGLVARAGAVACGMALLLQEPALLALGLACYLLEGTGRFRLPVVAFGAAALLVAALTGAAALPEGLGVPVLSTRLADTLGDRLVVTCLAAFILVRATPPGRWEKAALAAASAAACLFVLPAMYLQSGEATRSQSWNEVQAWVRDNTRADAMILTPPYREGFRVFSERSIVGEWKDGTQQFFDVGFTFEWHRRMARLKGDTHDYDSFDTATLLALGREYGAEYVVLPGRVRHPLPKLFQNSVAAVYRLTPPPAAEGPPATQ